MMKGEKKVKYILGKDNKVKGDMQRIRISQGCFRQCDYCNEPLEMELYLDVLDEICKNKVTIIDMNILDPRKPRIQILNELIFKRIDNKVIYYDMSCGFDFTQIDQEIAELIYKGRFGHFNRKGKWIRNIKLAWDRGLKERYKFKDCLNYLYNAGFKRNQISVFMIVNKDIPQYECDLKLDLLKEWNLKINNCCYDGGYKVAVPDGWKQKEIDYFRYKCALHNQNINFGMYPDLKRAMGISKRLSHTR